MNTLQKSSSTTLSVEQLAAMIKSLSPTDRDKLDDLMWDDYEVPAEHKKIVNETIERVRKDPGQLIPLDELIRRLKS